MKACLMAAAAALLAAGCTAPMAEDMAGEPMAAEPPMAADETGMPTRAPAYMAMAASSDMFEIESSRLAMQMSRSPLVRQFAQRMIADHTRMSQDMISMAQNMGLPMPPMQMMPRHAEMMQRLASATPVDFDMAYRREQIMAHEEALMLHRTFADRGDNASLRAMAGRAVPMVEMHLGQAQGLPDFAAPIMSQPPAYTPPADQTRRRGERG